MEGSQVSVSQVSRALALEIRCQETMYKEVKCQEAMCMKAMSGGYVKEAMSGSQVSGGRGYV